MNLGSAKKWIQQALRVCVSVRTLCGCISLLGLLSGKINLYVRNVNFSKS